MVGTIFYLHIECKIDGPEGTASFALVASLAWQILKKKNWRKGAKNDPPVGRGSII